ncbi:MAG TPA: hypothetical protein VGR96_09735 [Acidobacteriaceae bacterium]|nr:hypothetical protein [Acidobacteriaceae bacterium]
MPMYEEAEQAEIAISAITRESAGAEISTREQAVAELLRKAAFRVGQPGAWTQHYLGRFADGTGTYVRKALKTEEVHSHCMLGALYCEYDRDPAPDIHAAYDAIVRTIGTGLIADWNDSPLRTQDEVVGALIRAAELAEA